MALLDCSTLTYDERHTLAKSSLSSLSTLLQLAQDPNWQIPYCLAQTYTTPTEVLEKVAEYAYYNINKAQQDTHLSYLEIERQIHDYRIILSSLAGNINTPKKILARFAVSNDVNLREGAAYNTNTDIKVLLQLAQDEHTFVKASAAANVNLPPEVLEQLSHDWDMDAYIHTAVASNPNTPIDVLVHLSQDADWEVCAAVAKNHNTPLYLIAKFAKDKDMDVRTAAASNPKIPEQLLLEMYQTEVANDLLTEEFAIAVCQRDILDQTEVAALVAQYGDSVAQVVSEYVLVDKGSILEKLLAQNYRSPKLRPTTKVITTAAVRY